MNPNYSDKHEREALDKIVNAMNHLPIDTWHPERYRGFVIGFSLCADGLFRPLLWDAPTGPQVFDDYRHTSSADALAGARWLVDDIISAEVDRASC